MIKNLHLNESLSAIQKTNSGSYYTPKELVDIIHKWIQPYLKPDSIILDSAAGYGAFIHNITNHPTIGIDIDPNAVKQLKTYKKTSAKLGNSLTQINREDWDIPTEKHLVTIGNPPYNDTTSKNKRAEKTEKVDMHPKVQSRDYGIAFLKSYCELTADVVCILHPLSYLIKETNFNQLKQFSGNYKLVKAAIFSSEKFPDTRGTPFPVLIALYERNAFGMHYEDIYTFPFEILDSEKIFRLSNIETIDGYIRKYPPTKKDNPISDIGLYFYSIRDTNSLITSANFSEKEKFDKQITVNLKDFYKYAYLSCYKRYFGKDYLFGNVSPIIRSNEFKVNDSFQCICIIDSILNNSKIVRFSDPHFLESIYKEVKNRHTKMTDNDPYYIDIQKFLSGEKLPEKIFSDVLKEHFSSLKHSMLL